uniref:Uncharacterized protein n=1 Tax=Amphimedon queenslandica TaxID=400682 RepID=A0A1X7UN53_AMPQE
MGCILDTAVHHQNDTTFKTSTFTEIYKEGVSGYISESPTGLLYIQNENLYFSESRQPLPCTATFKKLRQYPLQDIISIDIINSTLRCSDGFKLEAPVLKICTINATLLASGENEDNSMQEFSLALQDLQGSHFSHPPPFYSNESSSLL